MNEDQFVSVMASVLCHTEEQAAKAAEVLSRACVGLALEGLTATLTLLTVDDDPDEG